MGSVVTLEQRLARQEAAEEVRALVADYAQACDTHDLKKLETIFAADMVISVPGASWSGLDDAIAFYRDAWTTRPVPLRHFITNVAMRLLEPDHVDATSSFLY